MGSIDTSEKSACGGCPPGKIEASLNEKLQAVKWGKYTLGDLFEVDSYTKRFDANKVVVKEKGEYSYIVRTSINNGQKGYIDEDKRYLSSDTWLRCRKKLMANKTFQGGRKAKNTWLAGKVKCGRCGYALMSVGNPTGVQYLRCSKRADSKSCDGCGTLRTREFERFLYGEMVKKLSEFQTLTAKRETVNPKLTALNMELAHVEDEIEKLLNTLTGANAVLLSYANSKIEELDTRRQALTKEIAALSAETISPEQIERLSVYLNQWEEIDFEDRRQVADGLISQIRATDEHVSIEWKI